MTTTGVRAAVADVLVVAHAEWLKLRSLRLPWLAVTCALALQAAACAVIGMSVAASAANGYDITASAAGTAADAAGFAQLPVVVVAILVVTGEYATGAIRLTLRATPRRGQLLLAKSLVAGAVGLVTGTALVLLGAPVAALGLGDAGTASGAEALARTAVGAGVSLALVSVLSVGVGAVLRGTVVTILVLAFLLLAVPTLTELGDLGWLAAVQDYLPSTAGEAVTSPDGEYGEYGAGVGVAVLGVWALVGQLAGYAALRSRDA